MVQSGSRQSWLSRGVIGGVQRWACHHQWVRARWEDGTYGLRCSSCMKAYPHTWDDILAAPVTAVKKSPQAVPEPEQLESVA